MKITNVKSSEYMRQGNKTVICAVTEALNAILENSQIILKNF